MEKAVKLQDFIQKRITEKDFNMYEDSTKGIIKLMILSTHQEYAYDFLKIMMNDERREYTGDLYPGIVHTEFYDFDLEVNDPSRYIITYVLPCEGDVEEVQEYFEECYAECDASLTDIIVDYYAKDNLNECTRIYSQNDVIASANIQL